MEKLIKQSSIIWLSIIFYFAIIELVVLLREPSVFLSREIFINRLIFLGIFLFSFYLKNKISLKNWELTTVILIYASLTILYKETAMLNPLFYPEIDAKLMVWDEKIFGFQPSLEFSKHYNSMIFSELMFFGYFSYYVMPIIILGILYQKLPEKISYFGFLIITSFLLYYVIFIFFPAFGPQFYLKYPENYVEAQGFFGRFIKLIQENGEAKTAAFPSSHVGVALMMMIFLYFHLKKYVKFFIPTVILLILATVYIKAHYFVDVVTGVISAPIVYFIVKELYKRLIKTQSLSFRRNINTEEIPMD